MLTSELRRLRKLHGMSLCSLAGVVGKSGAWLSRVERGSIDVSFGDMCSMLSHLGYRINVVLG